MSDRENLGSFVKENGRLAREWVETKMEMYKLILIRLAAKSAGYFIWILVSLFLLFLFIIFIGLTAGFWLSSLTNSYTIGFGIVTLLLIIVIGLLAAMRKKLFVNPIIRAIVGEAYEDAEEDEAS